MGWVLPAIEGLIIVGSYIYHRATEQDPPRPKPARSLDLPRVDEGAVYPLIYGRCRVDSPILAYVGTPDASLRSGGSSSFGGLWSTLPADTYIYSAAMLWVLGLPFKNGTTRVHRIYAGDAQLSEFPSGHVGVSSDQVLLSDLVGDGDNEGDTRQCWIGTPTFSNPSDLVRTDPPGKWIEGAVEFLDGNTEQLLVDPDDGSALTKAGEIMLDDGIAAAAIPGFRGKALVFLYGTSNTPSASRFSCGPSPNAPAFAFDVSSYPAAGLSGSATVDAGDGAAEANPIDVLYDLLTAKHGRLGLPAARIGLASFGVAAATLADEGHGYSRAFDERQKAEDAILDVLKQIDAVLYEDPSDGKIKIKLVRGDYDPSAVPLITPDNAVEIRDYAAGGLTGVTNKVRVVFRDRQRHYRDNSATAQNMANAVGQDNEVNEVVLNFPGVCTSDLAETIAARELAFRSRSLAKCRAVVDRSFFSTVPGDVVALTWPEYGISGKLFRVASVDRGTLQSGAVTLDLLQDPFYDRRGSVVSSAGVVGAFPTAADPG